MRKAVAAMVSQASTKEKLERTGPGLVSYRRFVDESDDQTKIHSDRNGSGNLLLAGSV